MSTGGGDWRSRRDQVRKQFLQSMGLNPKTEADPPTPPGTPGSVPSAAADSEVFSVMAGVPPKATSDTSATATGPRAKPTASLASTTPAASTKSSSESSTVWTVSPLGFLDQILKPSIVERPGILKPGLPPAVQESLQQLAIARSEPVEDVVQQIAEFFVEEEDERAEGTLHDALVFYMTNYHTAGV